MDGKSSDETVAILKKYSQKLSWFSEKDKGQTDAINKGIRHFINVSHQSGLDDRTFFSYLNSDDYYHPNVFAVVARAFEKHPECDWLVGDCTIVNQHGHKIQEMIRRYKQILRRLGIKNILGICNPVPQPAVFIRWSAVQAIGEFNVKLKYVMDYEYWLRLIKQLGEPILLDQTLAAFRVHSASKGGRQFVAQFDEELRVAKQLNPNPAWIFLHSVHNELIKMIYHILK